MAQLAALPPHRPGRVRVSAAVVDGLAAALLLAGELGELATLSGDGSLAMATVSCVVAAGAVAMRRRAPLAAALAALAGLVGYELATHDYGGFTPVAVLLTFYMVGRSGAWHQHPARGLLAVAGALAGCAVITVDLHSSASSAFSSWLVVAVVPLAAGVGVARRTALSAELAATAAQLRAEQDLNAARASAQERNRVARDLHDVVAHCVSVMVVQAGAARLVADRDPSAADRALTVVCECGREAMADLRRIVGVLRHDVDPAFGRGAGLADLPRLAERIRLAGVPTSTTIEEDAPLPPAVDVVAYRVAQEALTNVVKHARGGASAMVRVHVGADAVSIEVINTGGALAGNQPVASGHGLVGMRERVTAYGGDLRTGPRPDGGYAVRARIPLHAPSLGARGRVGAQPPATRSRRPSARLVDAAVVLVWLVALEAEAATSAARHGPWVLNALAVGAMALAAGWRRRSPLLFLAVVGALAAMLSGGLTSLDRSTITGLYTLAVPLFTVASWQSRRRAILGLACWTIGASLLAVIRGAEVGNLAGALAMGLVIWAAGRIWQAQRLLIAELSETTAMLGTERDQRAQLAVASERTRIARELHGQVAHGVVTMVVQAEVARHVLVLNPGSAADSIRAIEQNGRDALTQLRRILGVLRAPAGPTGEQTTHTTLQVPAISRPPYEALTSVPEEVLT